jgi:uracil-DNA glycosylase
MFFRGHLDGSAKVVVVGQEGAQDESLSHRSFTGGTGARMQHLLRHLGLDRSYLFLNSFVYPILGQYADDLRPLAQDRRSPIVSHRHRILDKAVVEGDVRLVVAVGRAAKESIATWIGAHGGSANPERLEQASLGSLPGRVRTLGVVHPGAATGGSTSAIRADFQRAANLVRGWAGAGPPATAPTPNGPSSCSRPPAATTPPGTGSATARPPPAHHPEMATRAVDAIQQRLTIVLGVAQLAVERHPNRSSLRVF